MPDDEQKLKFGYVDGAEASELSGQTQEAIHLRFLQSGLSGVHIVAHAAGSSSTHSFSASFLASQFPAVDWWAAKTFNGGTG